MGEGFLDKAYNAAFDGEDTGGAAARTKKKEEELDDLTQEEVEEQPEEEALTSEEITDEIAELMAPKENPPSTEATDNLTVSVHENLSPETVAALEKIKRDAVSGSTTLSPTTEPTEATRTEKGTAPSYEQMTFEELTKDVIARPVLERECWKVLQTSDRAWWNKKEYQPKLSADGHLIRADGTVTELTPSMVIASHPTGTRKGENLVRLAVYRAKDKLARRFPHPSPGTGDTEQREVQPEPAPESVVAVAPSYEETVPVEVQETPEAQETQETHVPQEEEPIEPPQESPGITDTQEPEKPEASVEQPPGQTPEPPADIPHAEETPPPSGETTPAETDVPTPEPEPPAPQADSGESPGPDSEPAVPEAAAPLAPVSEAASQPEQTSARREAREKYRALRTEMLAVRKDWEDAINEYENVRRGGLMGRIFDNNHLKEQADKAQQRYLELLDSVRGEREKRMKSFLEERSDNPEHTNRYAAFHEALLDRRIDQDLTLAERMNAGSKQPESSGKLWSGLRTARTWYAGLSTKDKVKLGAGVGFAVGAVGALGTGSALAMLGAGTVIAARRAGGVLATGTIGGSIAGFVKGNVDAFASKYVREKEKETKFIKGKDAAPVREQAFSQRKLSETLEQRLKIRKTGRRIRTAGTAGAVASVVGTAVVAGGSIAQGVHDALPESVQQAMDTATAAETAQARAIVAPEEQPANSVEDVAPQPPSLPEAEEATPPPPPVEELAGPDTSQVDEVLPRPQPVEDVAEEKSFVIQPPPPQPESVPSDGELKDLIEQLLRTEENLSSTEPPSPIEMPDDVPAHAEDINAVPYEPTPVYTVEKGDNIWKILEKNLEARGSFEGLNEAQRIHLVDDIKDEITKLSSGELKDMGIGSGKADLIHAGEHIDLSEVLNEEAVDKAIADAKGLTEMQTANIDAQQTGALVPEEHLPDTATPPPFSSVSSHAPAPFTSISALGNELGEQPIDGGMRTSDFSPQQTYEQLAKDFPDYRGEKTLPHFMSVWDTLKSQKELSTALLGRETHIRAAWGPLSHVPLRGVMDAQPGVEFTIGESPTALNVQAEQELRTIITKCYALPEGREVLRAGIARNDYTVGDFMRDLNERLEEKTAEPATASSPEPVAQLASLDASAEAAAAEDAPSTAVGEEQTPANTAPHESARPPASPRGTKGITISGHDLIHNDSFLMPVEGGVKIGGTPYRFVNVPTSDPIDYDAERLIQSKYLRHYPEWGNTSAADLLEQEAAYPQGAEKPFTRAWNERVRVLEGDAQQHSTRPTKLDPRAEVKLRQFTGADALKQLQDVVEDHKRSAPSATHHIRVRPFKD